MSAAREVVAFHEAGHAVAAYQFIGGANILYVALDPPDQPWLAGVCRVERVTPSDHGTGWHALAGPAAEQIAAMIRGRRRARADRDDVALAARSLGTRAIAYLPRVKGWLGSSTIWPWVEALASQLLSRGRLSGEEVEALLMPMGWPAPRTPWDPARPS